MNRYESMQENLQQKWDKEKIEFSEKMRDLYTETTIYSNQFNNCITIINVERHLMRREINALYKFLKHFGDIGTKLTPFDFATEDWLFTTGYDQTRDSLKSELKKSNDSSFLTYAEIGVATTGVTAASKLMNAPISPLVSLTLLPTALLVSGLIKRNQDKQDLEDLHQEFDKDRLNRNNDLKKMEMEKAYFSTAVQIAHLYRVAIAVVRDVICDKIIPELNGILAFLYADAIKNCIINNEDPDDAKIGNIAEYRGTPYEKHYTFVKNTFDFYLLITKFFTEPILTNLVQNRKVTDKEYSLFKEKLNNIDVQQRMLLENSAFGGDM